MADCARCGRPTGQRDRICKRCRVIDRTEPPGPREAVRPQPSGGSTGAGTVAVGVFGGLLGCAAAPFLLGCGALGVVVLFVAVALSTAIDSAQDTAELAGLACDTIPTELMATLSENLDVSGPGRISAARAYRSGAHQNAHFVAAELDASGLEGTGDHLVYLVSGMGGPGFIQAVNAMADQFTPFGLSRTTDAGATMSDPGASEAVACLSALQGR